MINDLTTSWDIVGWLHGSIILIKRTMAEIVCIESWKTGCPCRNSFVHGFISFETQSIDKDAFLKTFYIYYYIISVVSGLECSSITAMVSIGISIFIIIDAALCRSICIPKIRVSFSVSVFLIPGYNSMEGSMLGEWGYRVLKSWERYGHHLFLAFLRWYIL